MLTERPLMMTHYDHAIGDRVVREAIPLYETAHEAKRGLDDYATVFPISYPPAVVRQMEAIARKNGGDPLEHYLYRGHADIRYQLRPTLLRSLSGPRDVPAISKQSRIAEEFRCLCRASPEIGSVFDDTEIDAIGRHYGLTNGLLDFTTDMDVAISFAKAGGRPHKGTPLNPELSVGLIYRLDIRDLLLCGVGISTVPMHGKHVVVKKRYAGSFGHSILSFDDKNDLISGDVHGTLEHIASRSGEGRIGEIGVDFTFVQIPDIARIAHQAGVFLCMSSDQVRNDGSGRDSEEEYLSLVCQVHLWSFIGLVSRKVAFLNAVPSENEEAYPSDEHSIEIERLMSLARARHP